MSVEGERTIDGDELARLVGWIVIRSARLDDALAHLLRETTRADEALTMQWGLSGRALEISLRRVGLDEWAHRYSTLVEARNAVVHGVWSEADGVLYVARRTRASKGPGQVEQDFFTPTELAGLAEEFQHRYEDAAKAILQRVGLQDGLVRL